MKLQAYIESGLMIVFGALMSLIGIESGTPILYIISLVIAITGCVWIVAIFFDLIKED